MVNQLIEKNEARQSVLAGDISFEIESSVEPGGYV